MLGVVILLGLGYFVVTSNRFSRMRIKVTESESGIDVALVKRFDTLTKMAQVTKNYMNHEQKTLLESIQLRQNMTMDEKATAERKMDSVNHQFSLLAEAYPQIQADTVFIELQRAIADTEEHLQAARRLHNANVSFFNQAIAVFPASIVAGMQNRKILPMFQAEEHKRQDVSMQF